jgi:hypothetical protein
MHRLHEDDLVGHVLAQEDWEIVRFPAIAEEDESWAVETVLGPRHFTGRRGEALHPERETAEMLEQIRRTIGEYNLPASTSRPRHRRAAAWSRRRGSAATRRTNGRTSSTGSCRVGTPPTRRASQPPP